MGIFASYFMEARRAWSQRADWRSRYGGLGSTSTSCNQISMIPLPVTLHVIDPCPILPWEMNRWLIDFITTTRLFIIHDSSWVEIKNLIYMIQFDNYILVKAGCCSGLRQPDRSLWLATGRHNNAMETSPGLHSQALTLILTWFSTDLNTTIA